MDELDRARSALQSINPGCDRETWVRIGMAAKAAGVPVADFVEWSQGAPNFAGDADCVRTWRSFSNGAIGPGTLFHIAREEGWNEPAQGGQTAHKRVQTSWKVSKESPPEETPQRPANAVLALWERCEPATEAHPYIVAKNGRPDGLRVVPASEGTSVAGRQIAGWLVVPVMTLDGELRTVQLIPAPGVGKKLNFPSAAFGTGQFVVGDIGVSARVYITEGIGQAWACWRATGSAAVVSFGAGRMATVCEALRAKYPDLDLVIVADKGKEGLAAKVARTYSATWIEMPEDKPANYDANDYACEHGADELAELLAKTKESTTRYRLLCAREVASKPPMEWLVRGVLPAEGLACMYGSSGSGKSFLAFDLSAAVAIGTDWFSYSVKIPVPAVYVALEGEAGFTARVKAWQARNDSAVPDGLRFVMQPFDLRKAEDVAELVEAVKRSGNAGGLLVIDTLNRAASGADENSSADMGQLIAAAKTLQRELGGLVLLVHHSGKDATKGLRGHSSLYAALDAAIEVSRIGERREWRTEKAKDGEDGKAHPFRLDVVDIGADSDGHALRSCVVEPLGDAPSAHRAMPPKSGNQRIVWDALGEPLRQSAHFGQAGAPPGRPCITFNDAVEKTRGRLPVEAKRQTERAQAALQGLIGRRVLEFCDGWLWCA